MRTGVLDESNVENTPADAATAQPRPTGEHVDTWQMVVVHRMFRREFRQLPELVRGVVDGDQGRSEIVGEHLADMTKGLHHHHTGEDELLWPPLLQRVGSLNSESVWQMEKQHQVMAALLERVDTLLPRWQSGADASTRDELASVLDQVSAVLHEHLADEENQVLPLVSIYVTQAEWKALGEHGQSGLPKGRKGFVLLGAMLEEATPQERVRFLALLPAPVRLIWRMVGGGISRRAKARLLAGI